MNDIRFDMLLAYSRFSYFCHSLAFIACIMYLDVISPANEEAAKVTSLLLQDFAHRQLHSWLQPALDLCFRANLDHP